MMTSKRVFSALLYILGGILFMLIASSWQKYILGGLEIALEPKGFIVPTIVGTILGFAGYLLNLEIKNKYYLEKKARIEAQEHAQQLEQVNEDLRTLDYSISNALRTPVRQIHGYLGLLGTAEKDDCKSIHEYRKRSLELADHLHNLLDALLDFSKVCRNELQLVPVNLTALISRRLNVQLEQHHIEARNFQIEQNLHVLADNELIKIFLDMILDNAIEYRSPDKELKLEFATMEKYNSTWFYLKDNGIGIPENQQKTLFEPFHSFHTAAEFNGRGLGLAIAKRVIDRHKGQIEINSESGNGTIVSFYIPPAE